MQHKITGNSVNSLAVGVDGNTPDESINMYCSCLETYVEDLFESTDHSLTDEYLKHKKWFIANLGSET